MIDIVRLRRPGDKLTVQKHHWTEVPAAKRSNQRGFGLAIDAAEKELAAHHGADISSTFAPHDYRFDVYYDIKSSTGTWLSLASWDELTFAIKQAEAGSDVVYPVYLQDTNLQSYTFLGYTTFLTLQSNHKVIETGSSPYWPMRVAKKSFI